MVLKKGVTRYACDFHVTKRKSKEIVKNKVLLD